MSAVFTVSGGGTVTYADTGSFLSSSTWREGNEGSERLAAPKYGRDYPSTAGVAGAGTIDYGYRGQRIELTVWYVRNSQAGVRSAIDADMAALAAGPSTLVLDGATFYACELQSDASGQQGPIKSSPGWYRAQVKVVVDAKRNA